MTDRSAPITDLLRRWHHGDQEALEQLIPLVYEDLRRVAAHQLQHEAQDHTLTPTEVVHEAYLRLRDACGVEWDGRQHFFAIAATAMRRILVDHARRRLAASRGAGRPTDRLEEALSIVATPDEELLALDNSLEVLGGVDPRLSRVVECRFFAGLTEEETATALGVTARTVRRDWVKARGWLKASLGE